MSVIAAIKCADLFLKPESCQLEYRCVLCKDRLYSQSSFYHHIQKCMQLETVHEDDGNFKNNNEDEHDEPIQKDGGILALSNSSDQFDLGVEEYLIHSDIESETSPIPSEEFVLTNETADLTTICGITTKSKLEIEPFIDTQQSDFKVKYGEFVENPKSKYTSTEYCKLNRNSNELKKIINMTTNGSQDRNVINNDVEEGHTIYDSLYVIHHTQTTDDFIQLNQPKPNRTIKTHTQTLQKRQNRSPQDSNINFTRLILANIRHKNPTNKSLICDLCDYRHIRRYKMAEHMDRCHAKKLKETTKPKQYSCEICGIRMTMLCNLKEHMRLHSGEKPYACTFESCDRRFYGYSECSMHMRRHLGLTSHKCDQCQKSFYTKTSLNNHKLSHTNQRPFVCDQCGQSFKGHSAYRDHQQTHTNIRPFVCTVCAKTFRKRNNFTVHMNIHTDNRPYQCSLCDRGFHSPAARRAHEKKQHNVT